MANPKHSALKFLFGNPKTAKQMQDALSAPVGSLKREQAKAMFSSLVKVHPDGMGGGGSDTGNPPMNMRIVDVQPYNPVTNFPIPATRKNDGMGGPGDFAPFSIINTTSPTVSIAQPSLPPALAGFTVEDINRGVQELVNQRAADALFNAPGSSQFMTPGSSGIQTGGLASSPTSPLQGSVMPNEMVGSPSSTPGYMFDIAPIQKQLKALEAARHPTVKQVPVSPQFPQISVLQRGSSNDPSALGTLQAMPQMGIGPYAPMTPGVNSQNSGYIPPGGLPKLGATGATGATGALPGVGATGTGATGAGAAGAGVTGAGVTGAQGNVDQNGNSLPGQQAPDVSQPGTPGATGPVPGSLPDYFSVKGLLDPAQAANANMTKTEYIMAAMAKLGSPEVQAKYAQYFGNLPDWMRPFGADLVGHTDQLIQAKNDELQVDALKTKQLQMLQDGTYLKQDSGEYIRQKDQYLKNINGLLDDLDSKTAYGINMADPSMASMVTNYRNYLLGAQARTNQRYMDYINTALDTYNKDLSTNTLMYNDASAKLDAYSKDITSKEEQGYTQWWNMFGEAWDSVNGAAGTQTSQAEAAVKALETQKKLQDLSSQLGYTVTEDSLATQRDKIMKDIVMPGDATALSPSAYDIYGQIVDRSGSSDPRAVLQAYEKLLPATLLSAPNKKSLAEATSTGKTPTNLMPFVFSSSKEANSQLANLVYKLKSVGMYGGTDSTKDLKIYVDKLVNSTIMTEKDMIKNMISSSPQNVAAVSNAVKLLFPKAQGGLNSKGVNFGDPKAKSDWIKSAKIDPLVADAVWDSVYVASQGGSSWPSFSDFSPTDVGDIAPDAWMNAIKNADSNVLFKFK